MECADTQPAHLDSTEFLTLFKSIKYYFLTGFQLYSGLDLNKYFIYRTPSYILGLVANPALVTF